MRIIKTAISGIAIALAYVANPATAQTTATAPTAAAEVDQNAAIATFFEEYDAQQLALSPLSKSYRGIKDSDYGRWDDFTTASEARANDAARSALKEMRTRFDPAQLTPENRLSYRLFEKRAERSEAAVKYNDYGYAFDQMNGAQGIMPPKWVYPYVINDARNVITGAPFDSGPDAPLFADFKGKVAKLNISQIENTC